jgi:excisionase family DNA binding protein
VVSKDSPRVVVEPHAVLVPRLSPHAVHSGFEGGSESPDPHEFPTIRAERDIGFEPTTFSLGTAARRLAGSSNGSQPVENIQGRTTRSVQISQALGRKAKKFVTRLLPGAPRHGSQEKRNGEGPGQGIERFLTVLEASEHLGVSTATVYRLCKEGQLAHARVLNAVRISSTALAALVAEARRRA